MFLQGIYRALDSGPLEAWYVDATLAAEPNAQIESGLGAGTTVLSLAIASGALLAGGLIALDPFPTVETLALPVLVAIGLHVVGLVAIVALMREVPNRPRRPRGGQLGRGRAGCHSRRSSPTPFVARPG